MPNARGRPPTHKTKLSLRLSTRLMSEIKTQRPDLLKPNSTDFAYGKFSSWLENLVWKELRGKPKVQIRLPGITGNPSDE